MNIVDFTRGQAAVVTQICGYADRYPTVGRESFTPRTPCLRVSRLPSATAFSLWTSVLGESAHPQPLNSSSQEHPSVRLIRARVATGGKYSPASMLCQYRVLSPAFSAICSCVLPPATRIAATFFPKRVRTRQGSGFLDGITSILAKTESVKHEALPRFFKKVENTRRRCRVRHIILSHI